MRRSFNLRQSPHIVKSVPQLAGKRLIGRGAFAAVFEGSRPNTVYKLTSDAVSYWVLCDPYVGVKHRLLPKVVHNYGEVSEFRIKAEMFPVYLLELERLLPIRRGTPEKKLVRLIEKASHPRRFDDDERELFMRASHRSNGLPPAVRQALRMLGDFVVNFPNAHADLCAQNFMRRVSGDVVFSDPLFDRQMFESFTAPSIDR